MFIAFTQRIYYTIAHHMMHTANTVRLLHICTSTPSPHNDLNNIYLLCMPSQKSSLILNQHIQFLWTKFLVRFFFSSFMMLFSASVFSPNSFTYTCSHTWLTTNHIFFSFRTELLVSPFWISKIALLCFTRYFFFGLFKFVCSAQPEAIQMLC